MVHPEHGDGGRRRFIRSTAALGLLHAFRGLAPAYAAGVPGPGGELRVGGERAADLVIAMVDMGMDMEPMDMGGTGGAPMQGMDRGNMPGMNMPAPAPAPMPGMDHGNVRGMASVRSRRAGAPTLSDPHLADAVSSPDRAHDPHLQPDAAS